MKRGNMDVGGAANAATARITAGAQDETVRAQRVAAARRGLAAILCAQYGIDPATASPDDPAVQDVAVEFAETAAVLGLNVEQRRPGYCGCGRPLTVTATSHRPGDYDRGRCLACRRAARQGADGTDRPPTSTQERP